MKIDPNSRADLSAQIAQAIRDAIISGELNVDERLPSEAELSDQFQVSRPTVREALKRLGGAIADPHPARRVWRRLCEPHELSKTPIRSRSPPRPCCSVDERGELSIRPARRAMRWNAPVRRCRLNGRTADQLATMRAEIFRQMPARV